MRTPEEYKGSDVTDRRHLLNLQNSVEALTLNCAILSFVPGLTGDWFGLEPRHSMTDPLMNKD